MDSARAPCALALTAFNFAIPINWAKPYLNGQSPRPLSDVAAENTITEKRYMDRLPQPAEWMERSHWRSTTKVSRSFLAGT